MKGSVDDLNIEKAREKSRVFTITESLEPTSKEIIRSSSSHDNLHLHNKRRYTHHHVPPEVPHYIGTLKGRDLKKAKQLCEHTRLVDKHGRNQVSLKDMELGSACLS
ncbi:unnamed protein product [Oikopleura dioica]|uniref:Uncharacterized protein n=1 Tax=Oikopleura dioica TaxID=34765 RepID=E4WZI7_OIKDI|nr:unnamed protein product [Oikopleura dioica]